MVRPCATLDVRALRRDVAVADNGTLAAIALNCRAGGTDSVQVALYRSGSWTVSAMADSASMVGSRLAVSADGPSAVVAWGEATGVFAATYR
jgi:hypothetical protein